MIVKSSRRFVLSFNYSVLDGGVLVEPDHVVVDGRARPAPEAEALGEVPGLVQLRQRARGVGPAAARVVLPARVA